MYPLKHAEPIIIGHLLPGITLLPFQEENALFADYIFLLLYKTVVWQKIAFNILELQLLLL